MKKLFVIVLSFVSISLFGGEIDSRFFKAMHVVETGGRFGSIKGDNGKALGPLQIHKAYWSDAVAHDKSIGGKYEDCAGYSYSVKVVKAYLNRYCKGGTYEQMARCHNSGPAWRKKYHLTNGYWRKFEKSLK